MMMPSGLLTVALWLAVAGVAAAAVVLIVVLIREWKSGTLW